MKFKFTKTYIIMAAIFFCCHYSYCQVKLSEKGINLLLALDPEFQYADYKGQYPDFKDEYLSYIRLIPRIGVDLHNRLYAGFYYDYERFRSSYLPPRRDVTGFGIFIRQDVIVLDTCEVKRSFLKNIRIITFPELGLGSSNGYTTTIKELRERTIAHSVHSLQLKIGISIRIIKSLYGNISVVKEYYLKTPSDIKKEPLHPYFGFSYYIHN